MITRRNNKDSNKPKLNGAILLIVRGKRLQNDSL